MAPSSLVHLAVIRIFPKNPHLSNNLLNGTYPRGSTLLPVGAFRQPETCFETHPSSICDPRCNLDLFRMIQQIGAFSVLCPVRMQGKEHPHGSTNCTYIWISPRDPFPIVHQWGGSLISMIFVTKTLDFGQ